MAPTTREAQRAELHKTIWRIANDLRGSVDGWDFKSYVLGMLFYRFVSENLRAYINHGEHEAGDASFDYMQMSDSQADFARDEVVAEKGSSSCRPTCSPTSVNVPRTTRTSTRPSSGSSRTSRRRRLARTARTTSRGCSTTWTLIATSSVRLSRSAIRSW